MTQNPPHCRKSRNRSNPLFLKLPFPLGHFPSKPESFGLETASEDKEIDISADAGYRRETGGHDILCPKKESALLIWIALILAVIAAAGLWRIYAAELHGNFHSLYQPPAPSKATDPGNLNIKSLDISSKFVENSKIGKLFVITGKVKNEYPVARGSIQISGKIYTKDKDPGKNGNRILRQYSFGCGSGQCGC